LTTRTSLSVVLVSFNTSDLLRRCLASLPDVRVRGGSSSPGAASSGPAAEGEVSPRTMHPLPLEVIVVDNASHDGSADMVERDFPQVRLVRSTENLGFARATNLGLSQASGGLLLLLNPDTEVVDHALGIMAQFLLTNPGVAAVSPALVYPDGKPQHAAFRFPTLWMSLLDFFPLNHRLINSRLNGRYAWSDRPFRIDHPLGAAVMLRRRALDDVGPLDEAFFIYCEEVDWCFRARGKGWEIYQVPEAIVVHHGGQSTSQFGEEMLVRLHQSRYLLFAKHYSPRFIRMHRAITRLGILRRVAETRWAEACGRVSPDRARSELQAYSAIWRM
jgi:N-acetylglucosaminyl-diphospho-decaprenol L-rhamnosyltransferase